MEILLAIVAALGIISGFVNSGKDKITTVVQYRTTVVTPDDRLITDCDLPVPPDVEKYLNSTWTEREKILFDSLSENQKSIILCNVRLNSLREWKKAQENLKIEDKPN